MGTRRFICHAEVRDTLFECDRRYKAAEISATDYYVLFRWLRIVKLELRERFEQFGEADESGSDPLRGLVGRRGEDLLPPGITGIVAEIGAVLDTTTQIVHVTWLTMLTPRRPN